MSRQNRGAPTGTTNFLTTSTPNAQDVQLQQEVIRVIKEGNAQILQAQQRQHEIMMRELAAMRAHSDRLQATLDRGININFNGFTAVGHFTPVPVPPPSANTVAFPLPAQPAPVFVAQNYQVPQAQREVQNHIQDATMEDLEDMEKAPVYTLFNARTIPEVWQEWDVGISGQPPLRELEGRWSSKLRPNAKSRTAWCRRKIILDAIIKRVRQGESAENVVTELETMRGGDTLYKFTTRLQEQRKGAA